jgi:hygromycin-B 7''-O-kinase
MTASLPNFTDYEPFRHFAPIRRNGCRWRSTSPAAMDSPAQNLNILHGEPISSLDLDETLILKIFPPFLRGQFVSERAASGAASRPLAVPIPEIVFEGERDQWPYLVITRVYGQLGSVVWPRPA